MARPDGHRNAPASPVNNGNHVLLSLAGQENSHALNFSPFVDPPASVANGARELPLWGSRLAKRSHLPQKQEPRYQSGMIAALLLSVAVTVVDGDTLRIDGERIRLLGIDAPEIHGCRPGRVCVPGDGQASKRSLEAMMGRRINVQRVGQDRYGRTLAQVFVGGRNVACEQVRRGHAQYVAKWDNGGLLASECR